MFINIGYTKLKLTKHYFLHQIEVNSGAALYWAGAEGEAGDPHF